MRVLLLLVFVIMGWPREASAATLATFKTSLGTMELELFDEEKPITVSNFVKYVTSGRFENMFVQRWEPGFVIQGGGYYLEDPDGTPVVRTVKTFGPIQNEYGVGETFSNRYGTIAMARQSGVVNSATSQWFLNLKDNAFLDTVDEGFTVFGRVVSGTNVLNLFVPPPPAHEIYLTRLQGINSYDEIINMTTLPVRATTATYDDLVFIDISLSRDLNLQVNQVRGRTVVSWQSVAGVTNVLEYSVELSGVWQELTNVVGTGNIMSYTEPATEDSARLYRAGLRY